MRQCDDIDVYSPYCDMDPGNGGSMLSNLLTTATAAAISLGVATYIEMRANDLRLLQLANPRSSHVKPTPTGGGLGIVIGGSFATLVFATPTNGLLWVLAISLVYAVSGILDDVFELSAKLRLFLQLGVVAGLILLAKPFELVSSGALPMGQWMLWIIFLLVGVWWCNLFNFMDGIDGIAASQAAFMLLGGSIISVRGAGVAIEQDLDWVMIAVGAASVSFLRLNWPPASIFMGNTGSSYLAIMLLGLALVTVTEETLAWETWAILGSLFIVDATVTLLRRMMRGETVFHAHRRHAYQVLARIAGSHQTVTLGFILTNLLYVFPLAWMSGLYPDIQWMFLVICYLPLAVVAFLSGSGAPEELN